MPYEAEAHCAEAVNSEVDELVGDAMSDDAAAAQAFQNSMMERKMQVGTEGDLRLVSVRRTNPLGPDSPTATPAPRRTSAAGVKEPRIPPAPEEPEKVSGANSSNLHLTCQQTNRALIQLAAHLPLLPCL